MDALAERRALRGEVVVEAAARDLETLQVLAALRMAVFRDWPYLYNGNPVDEAAYLAEFLSDPAAVMIVARHDGRAVGAATASRLARQPAALSEPLVRAGFAADDTFCFGESVLLGDYRGRGIGHAFFDLREAAARAAGATACTFCAVVRGERHPLRPENARDLASFWRKRGYAPLDGVTTAMDWKDRDRPISTFHQMQFWARRL